MPLLGAFALIVLARSKPFLGSCSGDAINKDSKTTFLNTDDLLTMTDQMAAGIAADPEVTRVTAPKSRWSSW